MNRKQLTVKIDMTVIWLPERATDALMRDPALHILGAILCIFCQGSESNELTMACLESGDTGLTRIDDHSMSWTQSVSAGSQAHTNTRTHDQEQVGQLLRHPEHFLGSAE